MESVTLLPMHNTTTLFRIYLTAPTANYISILDKHSLTEHFGSIWRVKQQLTDTGNIWSNTSGTPGWFNKALRHTRGYLPSLWYRGTDAHGSNLLMLLSSCLLVIPRKTGKKHHERDLFKVSVVLSNGEQVSCLSDVSSEKKTYSQKSEIKLWIKYFLLNSSKP